MKKSKLISLIVMCIKGGEFDLISNGNLLGKDEKKKKIKLAHYMNDLYKKFDYTKSPEFLKMIDGKSLKYIEMKKKIELKPTKRKKNNLKFIDALREVETDDDIYNILDEKEYCKIDEIRKILKEIYE